MRILMIGAGTIGSIYGWALAQAGHHVVHLVRPGRADALCDGQPIDMFDRRKGYRRYFRGRYALHATECLSPSDGFEWVIVPVKHYALAQALEEVAPRAGTADFLLLTQNWRGTGEIDSILPRRRYVFGDAKAGGAFSAGVLIATLSAIDLGPPEGEPVALAHKAAELFRSAGICTRLHSDMLHYLWVQYAITGGPWAALVHAGSLDAMLHDRAARAAALTAGRECLEVASRRGVTLAAYPETKPFLTNSALQKQIYGLVMRWMFRHNEYNRRCTAHALGDPVEVKTFYDDLIATGQALGVPMPVMESYAESIRCFAGGQATFSSQNKLPT